MNLGKYYFTASTFSAARMGIGATSVLYMLSHNVSLGDIALIKIIQALVIFFAEVPTGLVADTLGRRVSLIFACIAAIISFACFVLFTNIVGFSIAEIFNALAISFWSGAFEALAVDNTGADKKQDGYIEYFFQKIAKYSSLAVMISGLIGGLIGDINLVFPFYFSAVLMLISMLSIIFLIEDKLSIVRDKADKAVHVFERMKNVFKTMSAHQKNAFKYAVSSEAVKRFFVIQIAIQFALQPVFHYWQPYFKSFNLDVATSIMGYIFFGYVLTQTLFSWGVAHLYKTQKVKADQVNLASAIVTAICFLMLGATKSLTVAVVAFFLLQGAISVFRNNIAAGFNRFISSKERSTILSSVSFISRLGMFAHLVILKYTADIIPVHYSFYSSFVGFLIVLVCIKSWSQQSVKVTA